ncbi:hypothetical protein GF354_00835 [Candidatus Peregrinibacteria bacterium]|nr:hypothetical protein [Candidatus Peregrinibacteria bacterium]
MEDGPYFDFIEEEFEVLDAEDFRSRAYGRSVKFLPNLNNLKTDADLVKLLANISDALDSNEGLTAGELKFLKFLQGVMFLKPDIIQHICFYREIIKQGSPIDESFCKQLLTIKYPWFQGANFSGLNLSGLQLKGMDLKMVNFEAANLNNVDFTNSCLSDCNFAGAFLNGANLNAADLQSSSFRGAFMLAVEIDSRANLNNVDFNKVILGLGDQNEVNDLRRFVPARLRNLDLSVLGSMSSAYADGVKFEKINFSDLDVTRGFFRNAVFRECELDSTDLSNSDFSDSYFMDCNLASVDLSSADLSKVHFADTDMEESVITNADLNGAVFDGVDLSYVRGLNLNVLMSQARFDRVMGMDTLEDFASLNKPNSVDGSDYDSFDEEDFIDAHPDNDVRDGSTILPFDNELPMGLSLNPFTQSMDQKDTEKLLRDLEAADNLEEI